MRPTLPELLPPLLDALPIGVVVLDPQARVVHFNRHEEQLSGRDRHDVVGRPFFERVAPCMNVRDLAGWYRQAIGVRPVDRDVDFEFDFPHLDRVRSVRVGLREFRVSDRPYGVLLVQDRSDEIALRELRERLTSLVVHDLKNPLATLTLSLGVLPEVLGEPDTVAQVLADSSRAAARMNEMLLDLLEVSRLRTARMPLDRSEVEVGELVADVAREARARAGGLRLSARSLGHSTRAQLDQRLVVRALDNLVSNAARYALGRIELAAASDGDHVVITVDDDGPGIEPADREALFEPFAQQGARSNANQGLGLTLVRLVAETHGGTARVQESPLGGARFELRLPRTPPLDPPSHSHHQPR